MLIVIKRPSVAPLVSPDARYMWVTRLPVKLRCGIFAWEQYGRRAWAWRRVGYYDLPANTTWRQVVNRVPGMSEEFRKNYLSTHYLFATQEQLAALHYFHESGDV